VTKEDAQLADMNGVQTGCPYAFHELNGNAYYVGFFWGKVVLG
jgi:hypothetical protein